LSLRSCPTLHAEKKSAFSQSKYTDDDDDEDELDVSGIVRVQSSELLDPLRAEAERERERQDKQSIPVSRTSGRLSMGMGMSSISAVGSNSKRNSSSSLTVDTAAKSPTALQQREKERERVLQGSNRGDQNSPSSRKDRNVSFDGSSARSSPSPSASSSAFRASGDILTQESQSLPFRGYAGAGTVW
jgi:hypothetical protein